MYIVLFSNSKNVQDCFWTFVLPRLIKVDVYSRNLSFWINICTATENFCSHCPSLNRSVIDIENLFLNA